MRKITGIFKRFLAMVFLAVAIPVFICAFLLVTLVANSIEFILTGGITCDFT